MTAPDLSAIRAQLAGITPGPWYVESSGHGSERLHIIDAIVRDPYGDNALSFGNDEALAEFVAAAPSIVAQLLAVVERQQALADELEAEGVANRNVAREIRKEPITNITRQEIRDHEQAATISENHARRIRTAITGEGA